jgi:hypothetical protein
MFSARALLPVLWSLSFAAPDLLFSLEVNVNATEQRQFRMYALDRYSTEQRTIDFCLKHQVPHAECTRSLFPAVEAELIDRVLPFSIGVNGTSQYFGIHKNQCDLPNEAVASFCNTRFYSDRVRTRCLESLIQAILERQRVNSVAAITVQFGSDSADFLLQPDDAAQIPAAVRKFCSQLPKSARCVELLLPNASKLAVNVRPPFDLNKELDVTAICQPSKARYPPEWFEHASASAASNPELSKMFGHDQAARRSWPNIDFERLNLVIQ